MKRLPKGVEVIGQPFTQKTLNQIVERVRESKTAKDVTCMADHIFIGSSASWSVTPLVGYGVRNGVMEVEEAERERQAWFDWVPDTLYSSRKLWIPDDIALDLRDLVLSHVSGLGDVAYHSSGIFQEILRSFEAPTQRRYTPTFLDFLHFRCDLSPYDPDTYMASQPEIIEVTIGDALSGSTWEEVDPALTQDLRVPFLTRFGDYLMAPHADGLLFVHKNSAGDYLSSSEGEHLILESTR